MTKPSESPLRVRSPNHIGSMSPVRVASGSLTTQEIIDQIYDAATLEDAVYWREEFVRRLAQAIAHANLLDPTSCDEVTLYSLAKAQSEQAIARLQMCIARNERWKWSSY